MFQPVVPMGGYAGWAFLNRTLEKQEMAFSRSPEIARDIAYFEKNIGSINSAEELVNDRRLLKVALGAFGLGDDINSRAFIRKILEEGTFTPDALANRLADKRYHALSRAFGFGDLAVPANKVSDFAGRITTLYKERRFEAAIGEQDDNMRLALNLRRDLARIAAKGTSANTKWYEIMGQPPLRKVFETAFGLPASFATINIDKQLETFRERAEKTFGSSDIGQFKDQEKREKLIRLFLLRADIQARSTGSTGGRAALMLLQGATSPLPLTG